MSLNDQRQLKHSQTTGVQVIQLDRNEESHLISLDSELKYPVLVSLNLLVTSPNKLALPPTEQVASLPSTSGRSARFADNSNESDISTIGATKTNNSSENDISHDE